jgi:hypothetical protein
MSATRKGAYSKRWQVGYQKDSSRDWTLTSTPAIQTASLEKLQGKCELAVLMAERPQPAP